MFHSFGLTELLIVFVVLVGFVSLILRWRDKREEEQPLFRFPGPRAKEILQTTQMPAIPDSITSSTWTSDYELVPISLSEYDEVESEMEDEDEDQDEHREPVFGGGFYVRRTSDGQRLSWETLPKSHGLRAMPIAGVQHRLDALQSRAVAPGQWLTLVPEPTNSHDPYAIGVWDFDCQQQVGYLPRREAKGISSAIHKGELFRCFSLWENRTKKGRVYLRVLVIAQKAKLHIPI